MAIQFSQAVRNAELDSIETTIGPSPRLRFYSGAVPANCAAAATGLLLADLALPADWLGNAAGGTKSLAGTWSGSGANTGNAGYYRICDSTGATCHEQGTVSFSGSAWAASTVYAAGQRVTNNGNVYLCTTGGTSAGSGGPSGGGATIADNTAVWQYLSAVGDMSLDNIAISASQTLTITAYSRTAGNA